MANEHPSLWKVRRTAAWSKQTRGTTSPVCLSFYIVLFIVLWWLECTSQKDTIISSFEMMASMNVNVSSQNLDSWFAGLLIPKRQICVHTGPAFLIMITGVVIARMTFAGHLRCVSHSSVCTTHSNTFNPQALLPSVHRWGNGGRQKCRMFEGRVAMTCWDKTAVPCL